MRDTLEVVRRGGLRRVHDGVGRPPWPAPWQTLYALQRRELIVRTERLSRKGDRVEEWAITEAGREALSPPVVPRRETVRSLRAPGGSTRPMQLGIWIDTRMPEPEPVDPAGINPEWKRRAHERHVEAESPRQRARRLAGGRHAA